MYVEIRVSAVFVFLKFGVKENGMKELFKYMFMGYTLKEIIFRGVIM
jgi:hypothetical protein